MGSRPFTIDGARYTILRDGKTYGLFDGDGSRVGVYTSVTNDLAPALGKLFDFHLRLPLRKGGGDAQATPAFLFLPFYVDQDKGWNDQRGSFTNLMQFGQSWAKDAMEYHTGIRPNRFYLAKGQKLKAEGELQSFRERRGVLQTVLDDLRKQLECVRFDLSVEAYAEEIESLLTRIGSIREQEEAIKDRLVDLYNAKIAIQSQIAIAKRAAQELSLDFDYAASVPEAHISCPTCGAHYENSFRERFEIANDEDSCQQLLSELVGELRDLEEKLEQAREQHSEKNLELQEFEGLLQTRKGEVTLREVLENEGRKEAQTIIQKDIDSLDTDVGRLDAAIRAKKEEMDRLTNRIRRREIIASYAKALKANLALLDVQPLKDSAYKQVYAKISETGSDLPRAILAYYYAILKVIGVRSSSTFCPILVDSPNQQDQDVRNLKRIYEFVRDERPHESQLILALVDTQGTSFPGTTIRLEEKLSVLQKSQYEEVAQEMRPMLNTMMKA